MKIASIKVGRCYETKLGIGECLSVGGTFPVSVRFRIDKPFPRGTVTVVPRDVIREVPSRTGVPLTPAKEGES